MCCSLAVRVRYAPMAMGMFIVVVFQIMQVLIFRRSMEMFMFVRMGVYMNMYVARIMYVTVGVKEIADDCAVFVVHFLDMQHIVE